MPVGFGGGLKIREFVSTSNIFAMFFYRMIVLIFFLIFVLIVLIFDTLYLKDFIKYIYIKCDCSQAIKILFFPCASLQYSHLWIPKMC